MPTEDLGDTRARRGSLSRAIALAASLVAGTTTLHAQDERLRTDPTAWWWYHGVSADFVAEKLQENGARLAARLDLAEPIELQQLKNHWLEALDMVEQFASSRPADEIGCLYYSKAQEAFVDPREASDAVPHFGRPGGVLPQVC